jgi:3-hydroxyacyl-CoA dehydrogenase/enoyl-CoA hydratase/3-hydroxybutyryl-CoA epimerase
VLDFLERAISSKQIKAVVLCSGKKDTFVAGADILPVYPITDAKGLFDNLLQIMLIAYIDCDSLIFYPFQTVFSLLTELERQAGMLQAGFERLAALKAPTVAAINGPALGGGLELALACGYRVCADHKKVQLGLPEVRFILQPHSPRL